MAMRLLRGPLFFLLLGFGAAEAGTLKAYRFEGGEYVLVSDLADFYHLGRDLGEARERAEYRAAAGQVSFQADRRDIELNGVIHWLGSPILFERNKLGLRFRRTQGD